MIEIVFGESACGSLKIAQTYGKGKYRGSAVSIFMRHEDGSVPSSDEMKKAQLQAQEQERIAWENAIPLGGKSCDVYCFDMALSVGDISDNGIGEQRKNVFKKMLSVCFVEDLDYQVEEKIQKIKTTLTSVIERYVAGEEIRIWYSYNPDELCGMYWLMKQLQPLNCQTTIYLVKLPTWEYGKENTMTSKIAWGEVSPGEWGNYITLQEKANPVFLSACTMKWNQLQNENAPLRAMLNGKLQSVSEDIYDSFILREIAEQPEQFKMAIVIGKVYNTAANYKRVLQYDPLLKGAIRKNLLTERIDIVKPLGWYRDSPTLTDVDVKYLLLYFEENYGLTVEKKIIDAVAVIANENRYHPVCDFLNALQWDGTERIRFCLHRFLGSDTDDYTYEALKLFLLGAISRAFKPGCKFEVMLCLVGGQGAGKSSFFRLLAVNDDWFSDDLKKLDDENVYRKMQGHWIIEMSEMIATANAKSIEEIKSFLSRQKETYKIPYETHPADRKRQCVFGGSSNTLDFLPLDRTGNRRFVPVMVYPERAEVHILADEQASREYINQMWAEAMEIYRSGNFRLRFSPAMNDYLKAHQKDFMPEDTKAGQILDYLERYSGSMVCSKQLYKEALGHDYDEPKQWELREINDIMNNAVTGWMAFSNPRYFPEPYRRQKGWERIRNDNEPDNSMDGFQEIPTEEMEQLGLPEEWLKQK